MYRGNWLEKQVHLKDYRTGQLTLRSKSSSLLGSMVLYFQKGTFHNKIHTKQKEFLSAEFAELNLSSIACF